MPMKEARSGRTTNIVLVIAKDCVNSAGHPVYCFDHEISDENHLAVAAKVSAVLTALEISHNVEGNAITVDPFI